jgi:hypothetical protein
MFGRTLKTPHEWTIGEGYGGWVEMPLGEMPKGCVGMCVSLVCTTLDPWSLERMKFSHDHKCLIVVPQKNPLVQKFIA